MLINQATVAVFAASEGHAHPRVVELPKTDEGLGFNVMGGKEQNSPIYISRIISGGVADRHGGKLRLIHFCTANSLITNFYSLSHSKWRISRTGLRRGDQLISVNGVNVEGDSHERAVELLKAAQHKVVLVVRYTPKVISLKQLLLRTQLTCVSAQILEEIEMRFDKNRPGGGRRVKWAPPDWFRSNPYASCNWDSINAFE